MHFFRPPRRVRPFRRTALSFDGFLESRTLEKPCGGGSDVGFFDKIRTLRQQAVGAFDDAKLHDAIEKLERTLDASQNPSRDALPSGSSATPAESVSQSAYYLELLAQTYHQRGEFDQALNCYAKAERLASGEPRLRVLRAIIELCFFLRRRDEAFTRSRQLIEILISQDDLTQARSFIARLPSLGERDAELRRELAELLALGENRPDPEKRSSWLTGSRLLYPFEDLGGQGEETFHEHALLVVDDDPDILHILGICLRRIGCRVLLAQNVEEAQTLAQTQSPSLIICDLQMPRLDGTQFFAWLRSQSALAHIPFVCLSSNTHESERIAAFKRGVEDYWTKPFSVPELTFRVKNLLRRIQPQADFSGRLSEVSFPEVLQTLQSGAKTGVLKVMSPDREAIFYLHNGNVIDAMLGNIVGEKAVYPVIKWLQGSFSFRAAPVDRQPSIGFSTQQLLMEAVHRYDEVQQLVSECSDLMTVFVVDETFETLAVPEDFAEEIRFLKALFDGSRTLGDCFLILEDDLESLEMIIQLIREGFLSPKPHAEP
jgi:CheY-like chemotaxis protein